MRPFGVAELGVSCIEYMKSALVILTLLLLATNGFWLYHTFDTGITITHQDVSHRDTKEALAQALKIIKASEPTASREEVMEAAQIPSNSTEAFEKDGYVWIGRLGLRFSEDGKLLEAVPAWN